MSASVYDNMPRIIGHRGAAGLAPENTISGFEAAARAGAKFVEIDVTLTKDNACVIHHDTNLSRCTDGRGPVLLKTLSELKALDAGSWFCKGFTGERIPTFQEALASFSQLGLGLNLEIKPCLGWQIPTAEYVLAEIRRHLPENFPLLVSSFDIETLHTVHAAMPELALGYLTKAIPPDWERRLKDVGCASFHCQWEFVTEEIVTAVKSAGYRFLVYTVNEVEIAQRLLDWGIDAVITDFPDRLLQGVHETVPN
ncbi:MAG: glycerophosphoryl diester phosphodiesterase [Sneathiella sp.]|nr:MAG: glycerophosphoryl diester phosphodiesterase [Sneathiella sp.]